MTGAAGLRQFVSDSGNKIQAFGPFMPVEGTKKLIDTSSVLRSNHPTVWSLSIVMPSRQTAETGFHNFLPMHCYYTTTKLNLI